MRSLIHLRLQKLFNANTTKNVLSRSITVAVKEEHTSEEEWNNAQPYNKIPGPKPLPIPYVGNAWRFVLGDFAKLDFRQQQVYLNDVYGDIVRMSGIGRYDFVFLYNPVHVEKLFRNESIWPDRRNLDSFVYYRMDYKKDFFKGVYGLLLTQGKEWHDFRNKVNQPMMQPRNVMSYITPMDEIACEFVEKIRQIRDGNKDTPKDFLNELNKWSLESIAVPALDTRLGCLDANLAADSETQNLINAVHDVFDLSFELDMKPSIWKWYSTPTFKKFIYSVDVILDVLVKHITNKIDKLKAEGPSKDARQASILEILLFKEENPMIAITMALDMLAAGIDTTSNATGMLLYNLAKNPEKQEKLAEEIKRVLPDKNQPITPEHLNEMKYLKACIKESHRLLPVIIGTARTVPKDLVIGNYQIPKGTDVVASVGSMCTKEKHYPRATEYLPERWLRSSAGTELSVKNSNPFIYLPFGFGPRSCVGKRFAELEMELVTARIIQNFKVSYNYGNMPFKVKMITTFGAPLQLKMEERV